MAIPVGHDVLPRPALDRHRHGPAQAEHQRARRTALSAGRRRRDAGFSIYYMGINTGAFLSPLVCGYLGQRVNWHLGFAAAGVGMVLGVVQYMLGGQASGRRRACAPLLRSRPRTKRPLAPGDRCSEAATASRSSCSGCCLHRSPSRSHPHRSPTRPVTCSLLLRSSSSSLAVFRRRLDTRRAQALVRDRRLLPGGGSVLVGVRAGGFHAQPVCGSLDAQHDARRELTRAAGSSRPTRCSSSCSRRSSPGCGSRWVRGNRRAREVLARSDGVGSGFALLVPAAQISATPGTLVSPMWLVGHVPGPHLGRVVLEPGGLSSMTKLAPARVAGLMMGVWFLGASVGNFLAAGSHRSTSPSRCPICSASSPRSVSCSAP